MSIRNIARTETGEHLSFTFFHTLVVGQTGSGKGSVIWSIAASLRTMWSSGEVKLYGIDPKRAEFKGLGGGVFEKVTYDADETADLLDEIVSDLKARQSVSGRHFVPSRELPWTIIYIDEFLMLMNDGDSRRKKRVQEALLTLLSQGRSDGFIVVAAAQVPQREALGLLRSFFAVKIALRLDTAEETRIVLGEGATENGADAHKIAPATPANQYATAGLGFAMVDGNPAPVRVRFPYVPDAYIEAWDAEARERRAASLPTEENIEGEER